MALLMVTRQKQLNALADFVADAAKYPHLFFLRPRGVAGSSKLQCNCWAAPVYAGQASRALSHTVIKQSNFCPSKTSSDFEVWHEMSMLSSCMAA